MNLSKNQKIILAGVLIFLFVLVYSPHLASPFPFHIDEWHHITEAIKVKQGIMPSGITSTKIGFHLILVFISFFFELITIYKFLPAILAVLSALTLFYITLKKTSHLKKVFFISLFTVIFFASIKSNVNITGLWFFTPLTFSIPFIYLYVFFFTEGIENQNNKFILISLIIMVFLLFIHSISVLFAIPMLFIYALINFNKIKNNKVFFSFLIIPIIGFLFFKFLIKKSWIETFVFLIKELQFKKGWGVLEIENSFFELYSPIGYFFAFIGLMVILLFSRYRRKFLIYAIWPITLLFLIFIFKYTTISFLSPYQRNLYYFVISLPFLSSFGLYYLIKLIERQTNKIKNKKIIYYFLTIILLIIVIFFIFKDYYKIPEKTRIYNLIDEVDYETLVYLSKLPKSIVIAPASLSVAIFPITGHEPVGTMYFYGNRTDVEIFFKSKDCETKNQLIEKYEVFYVLSKEEIKCNWDIIYNKNNIFVYRVNS